MRRLIIVTHTCSTAGIHGYNQIWQVWYCQSSSSALSTTHSWVLGQVLWDFDYWKPNQVRDVLRKILDDARWVDVEEKGYWTSTPVRVCQSLHLHLLHYPHSYRHHHSAVMSTGLPVTGHHIYSLQEEKIIQIIAIGGHVLWCYLPSLDLSQWEIGW